MYHCTMYSVPVHDTLQELPGWIDLSSVTGYNSIQSVSPSGATFMAVEYRYFVFINC